MAADKTLVASSKRRKVSKKSKRSWRKHTDIKDIEEHLEEVRREERTGGAVAEKPDKRLFFVDKEKPEENQKQDGKVSRKSKKRKLLKADELLLPNTIFKPVGGKKRKVKRKQQGIKTREESDSSGSEDEPVKANKIKAANLSKKIIGSYDLWATHEKVEGDEHYLRTTRKAKIKAPKTFNRKTSQKAAVEVPEPGASYNPAYDDYQDLMRAAHKFEVIKLKENNKIERQLKFPTAEEMASFPTWEEEMGQGLFGDGDGDDGEDDNDDDGGDKPEAVVIKPVRAINRKTKQEKTKVWQQREEEKRVAEEKKKAGQKNQIFRLKKINKEIRDKEKALEKRQKRKEEKQKQFADKPKRLGKLEYEPPEIEIQLSNELTGKVRTLKPEGNLFQDRFKSFQRRNLIEPRKRVFRHRRYALKEYVRRSSKKPCIKEI